MTGFPSILRCVDVPYNLRFGLRYSSAFSGHASSAMNNKCIGKDPFVSYLGIGFTHLSWTKHVESVLRKMFRLLLIRYTESSQYLIYFLFNLLLGAFSFSDFSDPQYFLLD